MPSAEQTERVRKRIKEDTPFWASNFATIKDKKRNLVRLTPNEGQLELDRMLEGQRAAGKPMRLVALKARKIGVSTWAQAKLLQRATQWENYDTMSVAQDRKTGPELYRMAEIMYENLPSDKELAIKPPIGNYSQGAKLHFGDKSRGTWEAGTAFPNSTYEVDTAKEGAGGRGRNPAAIHCSEIAFWDQIGVKLTALLNSITDEPETIVILESTANGHNEFKDIWDDAEAGVSEFAAFFWPWYRQREYRLDFPNEHEREAFTVGEGPYGEEEPDLVDVFGVSIEQLLWRRKTIANKCGGDLRVFHQEYPTTAEQAFLSTGQKVFDPYRVQALLREVEQHDPKETSPDNPGPTYGELVVAETTVEEGRTGDVIVPTKTLWVPREGGLRNQPWKFWVDPSDLAGREFIIGNDVSGGMMESTDEPDFHAIEVIDHKTREQVAEYASRVEPDELAEQLLLAALLFNDAVVAVERTGGWGLPVIRKLLHVYHYWNLYRSKRLGSANEKSENKYGWDTNTRTKPMLIAGMQAQLREADFAGIKSRVLAKEVDTYVKDERGRANAAPKAYDDRLVAYMIAQFVASERPLLLDSPDGESEPFRAQTTGLSAYDPRIG